MNSEGFNVLVGTKVEGQDEESHEHRIQFTQSIEIRCRNNYLNTNRGMQSGKISITIAKNISISYNKLHF